MSFTDITPPKHKRTYEIIEGALPEITSKINDYISSGFAVEPIGTPFALTILQEPHPGYTAHESVRFGHAVWVSRPVKEG
jgi:hypothetical protein